MKTTEPFSKKRKKRLDFDTWAERERYEGKLEGKLEDARLMKAKGYPVSDILEITGLTREELGEVL